MPIFRKLITESSKAIFAIKADTKEEADKAFDDFFDDDKKYDEYREHMNCVAHETIINLASFENEDTYNRCAPYSMTHDFYIEAPEKKKEPKYTLYIVFGENVSTTPYKVFNAITIEQMAELITKYNKDYILKKSYANFDRLAKAINDGTTVIVYTAERRK